MGGGARPRTRARRAALQALYQWQLTGQPTAVIETQFVEEQPMEHVDMAYFQMLLRDVADNVTQLDDMLNPMLDRPLAQVDQVERAILRLGAFELGFRKEVPWRVVLNEAIELAKAFGAEQSHKYINGILDKVARKERMTEIRGAR